jgi:prolipoprotein diacylglyceryltransferase
MPAFSVISIIWDVSPTIFTLELFNIEIPINWYGLLFAVSFVAGQQLLLYLFKKDGKPVSDVEILTIYAAIATVLEPGWGIIFSMNGNSLSPSLYFG